MAAVDDAKPEEVVLAKRVPLPGNDDVVALLVTLNRPRKKNCFNTHLCHNLATVFRDAADEIRRYDEAPVEDDNDDDRDEQDVNKPRRIAVVILTGAGPSFCAGADLSNPPNPLHQSSDLPHHLRWNPVHQMSRVGVPIIGALRGHVITGGFELALACDVLVGDGTTSFRDTHVQFGLAPCWGLSQRLARRIGPGRASIVSLTARPVRAAQAHEWGLLDELVVTGDAEETAGEGGGGSHPALRRALELAAAVASNNALMVRRYKRALVEGRGMDHQKGLQRERELALAHYTEVVSDGTTFEGARDFVGGSKL